MSRRNKKVSFNSCNKDALKRMNELRPTGNNTREAFSRRFKTYNDYLKSKEWNIVKKIFLNKNRNKIKKCIGCGSKENIHVHHRSYNRLGLVSEYKDLVTVCADCHKKIHDVEKEQKISVRMATAHVLGSRKSCNKKQKNIAYVKVSSKQHKKKKREDRNKRKTSNRLAQIRREEELKRRNDMIYELREAGVRADFLNIKTKVIDNIYSKYITKNN